MNKTLFYDFWMTFFPEFKNGKEIENLYYRITMDRLDLELGTMLESLLEDNCELTIGEDIEFYFRYKHNDYQDIHNSFGNVLYYNFYIPFINYLIEKVTIEFDNLKLIQNKQIIISLISGLYENLSSIAVRILIQENDYLKKIGKLDRENNSNKLDYYSKIILTDKNNLTSLFKTYSGFLNLMVERTKLYTSYVIEILKNLFDNKGKIKDIFGIDILGEGIADIEVGTGDSHNGGKTVTVIKFQNGKKLVYKPRSLKMDIGFNRLIDWLNLYFDLNSKGLELKTYNILDGNDFGIVEFINYEHCFEREEIIRYYLRVGYLLAVLYTLNAMDMHYENIIACGEHPVLVDLETLFHPPIEKNNYFENFGHDLYEMVSNSVIRIGMLPFIIKNDGRKADIGGLGGEKKQRSPFKGLVITGDGNEDIKIAYTDYYLEPQKNNPALKEDKISSVDYYQYIIEAFRDMYLKLLNNKKVYIEKLKELFSNCEARIVLRDTFFYSSLLQASYHPDCIMENLSRKVLLCRVGVNSNFKNQILAYEYNHLLSGDIPKFNINIDSVDLKMGQLKDKNFIYATPMEQVVKKIQKLSINDLKQQENFIKIAYYNKRTEYDLDKTEFKMENSEITYFLRDNNLSINLLDSIAEYLVEQSIEYKGKRKGRTWVGAVLAEDEDGYSNIGQIGPELYNGEAGIGLFLTYYGLVRGKKEYLEYSKETMAFNLNFIDKFEYDSPYLIGGFNGLAGRLYPITKLYAITLDNELKDAIIKYLNSIKNLIELDKNLDIIGGTAGALHVLLSIKEGKIDEEIENLVDECVLACVEHLKKNIKFQRDLITWELAIEKDKKSFTGFGHGNAGIVSALARYKKIFEDKSCDELITKVLKYQDTMYTEDYENWLRDSRSRMVSYGWCHGAPGILLSELILRKYEFENQTGMNVIEKSLNTTISKSFGNNPTLCHGDLGNLEITYAAAEILKNENLKNNSIKSYKWILENIIKNRWHGKSFRGIEVYGLMLGLAGFGYFILKLENFDDIPSVLWLQ